MNDMYINFSILSKYLTDEDFYKLIKNSSKKLIVYNLLQDNPEKVSFEIYIYNGVCYNCPDYLENMMRKSEIFHWKPPEGYTSIQKISGYGYLVFGRPHGKFIIKRNLITSQHILLPSEVQNINNDLDLNSLQEIQRMYFETNIPTCEIYKNLYSKNIIDLKFSNYIPKFFEKLTWITLHTGYINFNFGIIHGKIKLPTIIETNEYSLKTIVSYHYFEGYNSDYPIFSKK